MEWENSLEWPGLRFGDGGSIWDILMSTQSTDQSAPHCSIHTSAHTTSWLFLFIWFIDPVKWIVKANHLDLDPWFCTQIVVLHQHHPVPIWSFQSCSRNFMSSWRLSSFLFLLPDVIELSQGEFNYLEFKLWTTTTTGTFSMKDWKCNIWLW